MNSKPSGTSRVLLGLAVAGALGLVGYGVVQSQDYEPGILSTGHLPVELLDSSDIRFFYPSDPEFIVIGYHWGRYTGTPALQVSGDGIVRSHRQRTSYRAGTAGEENRELIPEGTQSAELSFEEMTDLITSLLDTDILEFDEDLAQDRLNRARIEDQAATGDIHMTSAVGVHEIVLRFSEIRPSAESEPIQDFEYKVTWREGNLSLDRAVELYPELVELGRLLEAIKILRALQDDTLRHPS